MTTSYIPGTIIKHKDTGNIYIVINLAGNDTTRILCVYSTDTDVPNYAYIDTSSPYKYEVIGKFEGLPA